MKIGRRSWLEIDMGQILKNIDAIRANMKPETAFCAIIKADAYGHGAQEFARFLDKVDKVDFFGVACSDEAIEVRRVRAKKPILIIGYSDPLMAPVLEEYNISQGCFSLEYAKKLNQAMEGSGKKLKVHIKIDTGLSRLGILNQRDEDFQSALVEIKEILSLPNLYFEGIYTHFANAWEIDTTFADHQYNKFMEIVNALHEDGCDFKYVHCNNSPGCSYHPEKQGTMARPGTTLYGYPYDPSRPVKGLVPVMQWKARIAQIKEIPAGAVVSYGCTFKAEKPMRVAVITVGYADGIFRILQDGMRILVNGQFAHIIGVMCMDMFVVDITHIEDAQEDQTVTIFGYDNGNYLDPAEMSSVVNLHPLLMGLYINRRIPRVYFLDGKEIYETNYYLQT